MKARICGVLLCVVAFLLSMLLLLNLIENPMSQVPSLGDGNSVADSTPDGSGKEENNVSTNVTSIEGVMAVAKETQSFFTALATDANAKVEDLSQMKGKWHNAAVYLKERAADTKGAALYTALEGAFEQFTATMPVSAADFSAKANTALSAISEALIEEKEPSGVYPKLSASENGEVAMTLLRLWRASQKRATTVTVTYGGEVAMGDYIGADSYHSVYAAEGATSPLKGLVPVFATDDISVITLNAPLTAYTVPEVVASEAFRGAAADIYAKHLKDAGVDVVVLSACHMKDFGETGYQDTKTALEQAGLTVVEDGAVVYFNTPAGKIAILAFDLTKIGDIRYTEIPKAKITEAKTGGAIHTLVYFHGAETKETTAAFANTLRDAAASGASLVFASHEENIQGILLGGEEKTSLVLSPGELSYAAKSEGGRDAFLFQQTLGTKDQPVEANRILYSVDNHKGDATSPFAPSIRLDASFASKLQSALVGALPNFQGRVTEGDLFVLNIQK